MQKRRICLFTSAQRLVMMLSIALLATWASAARAGARGHDPLSSRWVATWTAAAMKDGTTFTGPSRSFRDQSIRQVAHVSVGGSHLRVQLSNEYGAQPLVIGAVHVALQSDGASIVLESDRVVTFEGSPSAIIPPGEALLSDAVRLHLPSHANLAVSIYVPEDTGPATFHAFANQTEYISLAGDFTGATHFPTDQTSTSRHWLTSIEVLPPKAVPALVAFGDSITEGGESTLDANHRWTDFLSRRVNSRARRPRLAVLNQGIGCGRLLTDVCGPSGQSRFERDVLEVTGVTHVVLALGFADIFFPTAAGAPDQVVSAEAIIAGLEGLAFEARGSGLEVYGATFTPNEGSTFPGVHTPENEAKRQAVNHWIRTTSAFDGVFDFDAAVRDPSHPARLLPQYASHDNLHLSDAGYEALASSIDLSLLG